MDVMAAIVTTKEALATNKEVLATISREALATTLVELMVRIVAIF